MDVISVIVPIYNVEKHLKECIDSILSQTYPALEVILIDDGSTDDSLSICEEYRSDERVKVYSKSNEGAQITRNYGLRKATGEYLTFVDSDDVLERNAYSLAMEALQKYDADLVFYKYVTDFGEIRLRDDVPEHVRNEQCITNLYDNYLANLYIGGVLWNKVWKREKLEGIWFDEKIVICEDALFVWKTLKNMNRAVSLPDPLYRYRYSQQSISKSSTVEKCVSATVAWDIMKKEALAINTESIQGICINRIAWNLKVAKTISVSGNKSYDWRISRKNVMEDKKYFNRLEWYNRISVTLLLKSWPLFGVWIRVERRLIALYLKLYRLRRKR